MSFAEVRDALRSNLEDQPGGFLTGSEGDIQLRGIGAAMDAVDIKSVPIRTDERGGRLTIGDVAEVEFSFGNRKNLGALQRPAVVESGGNQNR